MTRKAVGWHQGFTLLEVLSVITILLIVAAIVYPAFATAKYKARQTTCISQMREMAVSYQMYRQDYDGMDMGSKFSNFGLPDPGEMDASIDWIIQPYWGRTSENEYKCPNRYISPLTPRAEGHCPQWTTYQFYFTFAAEKVPRLMSNDSTWPIVYCTFHDLPAWRGETPGFIRLLGIGLDGSLQRRKRDLKVGNFVL